MIGVVWGLSFAFVPKDCIPLIPAPARSFLGGLGERGRPEGRMGWCVAGLF
jgi:hypothetical protein